MRYYFFAFFSQTSILKIISRIIHRKITKNSIIISTIISFLASFSLQHQLVVFHNILNKSKNPQVSRTRLSILANLNIAMIFMVSILPLSQLFQPSGKIQVFVYLFIFFHFHSVVLPNSKIQSITRGGVAFFSCFWLELSGPFVTESIEKFIGLISRTNSGLYKYHLLVWSNLNFDHLSHPVLHSFCASLLHITIIFVVIIIYLILILRQW